MTMYYVKFKTRGFFYLLSNCCNDCNVTAHLTRNNYFNDQPNHKGSFPLDYKPDHYGESLKAHHVVHNVHSTSCVLSPVEI